MESPFITTITNIYICTLLFLTLLFIVSKLTNNEKIFIINIINYFNIAVFLFYKKILNVHIKQ